MFHLFKNCAVAFSSYRVYKNLIYYHCFAAIYLSESAQPIITTSIKRLQIAWLKRTTKLLFHTRVPTTLNKANPLLIDIHFYSILNRLRITRISTQYFATLVFSGVWLIFFRFFHKHAYKINLKKKKHTTLSINVGKYMKTIAYTCV